MQVQSALLFETPVEIWSRVYRALRPRAPLPEFQIRFGKFVDAHTYARLRDGKIEVKITDVLDGAPSAILEALAYILLGKLFRKPVPAVHHQRYRRYMNRREMRRSLQLLRQVRGRKFLSGAAGEHHNLEEIFEELNLRFFDGLLARPQLGWSKTRSRTMLGHYDPSHNAIIVSRIFDDASLSRLGLEYVMFHEMLHLCHPPEHGYARRRVHTQAFRQAERGFPALKEAKLLLSRICGAARGEP
jgi:hypothetical protein